MCTIGQDTCTNRKIMSTFVAGGECLGIDVEGRHTLPRRFSMASVVMHIWCSAFVGHISISLVRCISSVTYRLGYVDLGPTFVKLRTHPHGLECVVGALLMRDVCLAAQLSGHVACVLGAPPWVGYVFIAVSTGSVPCGFTKPTPLRVMPVTGVMRESC